MWLTKAWTAIDWQSVLWKSDLTDKMKCSFFQAAVVSILLYGCTTWTLTKRMEKKLDSNYTRMLRAILNKSWRKQPTKQQLYGHQPPIAKTIKFRRTRHAGHCWRSRSKLISDVLLWTPSYSRVKAGRPARRRRGQRGPGISVLVARQDDDDDWRPEETYCYSDISEKLRVKAGVKNSTMTMIRIILGPYLRNKKIVEREDDVDTNCSWCTWNKSPKGGKALKVIERREFKPCQKSRFMDASTNKNLLESVCLSL